MGFRTNVQRASIVGLGCAGAVPTLQRVTNFVRSNPGHKALMLAVEICSARYYLDNPLETVVGNPICADGAAALHARCRAATKSMLSTGYRFRNFHRYGADRRGWTSTPGGETANLTRSLGSAHSWSHDRKCPPAGSAVNRTLRLRYSVLGRSTHLQMMLWIRPSTMSFRKTVTFRTSSRRHPLSRLPPLCVCVRARAMVRRSSLQRSLLVGWNPRLLYVQ